MGLIKEESGFIYIPIFDELENGDIIVTMLFSPGLKRMELFLKESNEFRFYVGDVREFLLVVCTHQARSLGRAGAGVQMWKALACRRNLRQPG